MKVHLLRPAEADEPPVDPPANADVLVDDLGLEALIGAMARGDRFLERVARRTVLVGLTEEADILYRHDVLRDALTHPALVRDLYQRATDAVTSDERKAYVGFGRSAATTLAGAGRVMEFLVSALRGLRDLADRRPAGLRSEGLSALFDTVARDLDDAYLTQLTEQLQTLRFPEGIDVHARLGRGLKVAGPVLTTPSTSRTWLQRLLPSASAGDTIKVAPHDRAGSMFLDELRERSLHEVATALTESTDHVTGFFENLRAEVAFYVGCLNLHDALVQIGEPVCFPEVAGAGTGVLHARGLYDAGLCLRTGRRVVGNDVDARGRNLVMITGANQGGKSTFLRSVGMSQLMTLCGMFAAADSLRVDVGNHVFTHFKAGEDPSMIRGRLDEELARMSDIADRLRPGDTVLLNESFSSTNEREGSEIAAGVVCALIESGIRVFYVTHLLGVGDIILRTHADDTLFLRAERRPDGRRTFRLVEGQPLSTGYAADLYQEIFGTELSR